MKRIFPNSFYNIWSLLGAGLAGLSLGLILFLLVLEAMAEHSKPYMGIITFIILPIFLVLGLLLIAWGIWREHRLRAQGKTSEGHLPKIDLNNPKHRTAFSFFMIGTILFLALSAFGSFKAYEYSDSDQFCGEICHNVMHPEYTAYQFSPHARVGCAQCHIGSGAEWFVKAKISGAYQVYSVIFNKYSKPIPTPIENLRPAQETCEQCHWPKHFFSEKQRHFDYFISDEKNTRWSLNLLMKIGGGNNEQGATSGIHWHMNIKNEITYAPLDSSRQTIPWVKVKGPDGKESIYKSTEVKFSDEQVNSAHKRRMDCIDCHNRPTHIYHHPSRSVNELMSIGWIDRNLPFVKNVAVRVLNTPYLTNQNAMDSIAYQIRDFYKANYPEMITTHSVKIDSAIAQVQKIYNRNFFPEMRVSWKGFPDNIGHMYSPGCFRCHDGKHVNESGKVLSRDCNVCHTLLAQKFENDKQEVSMQGVNYRHPVDVDKAWMEMNCYDCHREE
ncbi:NapC/NirT family cytochrome c [bacterium]|nr:NapC/NirT family cytochrome c [bacterium]